MVGHRWDPARRLNEELNATVRIIFFELVMDAIYQGVVARQFYPAEAVRRGTAVLRLSPT
jgi:hypothetical protein